MILKNMAEIVSILITFLYNFLTNVIDLSIVKDASKNAFGAVGSAYESIKGM